MGLKLKTGPLAEPLSLFEVKDHLRLDHDDHSEDDLLQGLIKAARQYCENYQNRAYIDQTWELWLDEWPDGDCIELPRPPLDEPAVIAGSFVVGENYRILAVGTTNFTAIGAAANVVGTVFTATGAGSGTGTATASVIIKYYGTDDTEYTFSGTYYQVDKEDQYSPRIGLKYGQSWPATELRPQNGVCVTFVAGYGDDGYDMPQAVRQAMLLLIGQWYENRESVIAGAGPVIAALPMAVEALLTMEKVY